MYELGTSKYIYLFIGDSLRYHNRMGFSTPDRDNDVSSQNCAGRYQAGWWYKSCFMSNFNGLFNRRGENGLTWYYLDNGYGTILSSKIMLRTKIASI